MKKLLRIVLLTTMFSCAMHASDEIIIRLDGDTYELDTDAVRPKSTPKTKTSAKPEATSFQCIEALRQYMRHGLGAKSFDEADASLRQCLKKCHPSDKPVFPSLSSAMLNYLEDPQRGAFGTYEDIEEQEAMIKWMVERALVDQLRESKEHKAKQANQE